VTNQRAARTRASLSHIPRALGLVWQAAPKLTVAWAVILLFQGVLPVATVYLTRLLVDSLVQSVGAGVSWESVGPTVVLAAVMALLLLASQLLQVAAAWIRTAQSEFVQDHLSAVVHERAYAADLAFYESAEYHDRLSRARGDSSTRPLELLENGGNLGRNTITLLGMAALLVPYGPWVPVVLIASTLPALYIVFRFNRRFHAWWERTTPELRWAGYYDWMLTYSEFAAELRLFDLGRHFKLAYQDKRKQLRSERLELQRQESVAHLASGILALVATGLVMAWMVLRAFRGSASLGDLVLFYQAFNRGQSLLRSVLGNLGQIYSDVLFLENLFQFIDLKPQIVDPVSPREAPVRLEHGIEFRSVTFRYPGSESAALENLDLVIPAGQVVAVLGPNGAGKSTLIKLLCRFYDPQAGAVELDGIDVRDMRVLELRRLITVLFQTPVAYHASLGENIAVGDLPAGPGEHEIEQAARGAGAHEIAARLPDGYETLLGKWFAHGTQLSSGEWQRVALARAFLRNSEIIVLDEPTSLMDSWSEVEWLDRFRQLAAERTALIVTHRLTVAMKADMVHVMDRGRIVESGPPQELLAGGGRFARSWAAQLGAGGTEDREQPPI
jgi:ATP-binding cassette subfamily B protein